MIGGLKVLGLVPARGGSKGVPRKNIAPVAGRPLIAWTIEAALGSRFLDRVVLSSEDEDIMAVARSLGCDTPFRRPAELAADDTPGIDPVLHAVGVLQHFDLVVLLQPTSPLRIAADIDGCIGRLLETGAPSCVTVREAADHPYWTYMLSAGGVLQPFVSPPEGKGNRRQDLPRAFALNGAAYAARVPWLVEHRTFLAPETVAFEMPGERSLDVDTLDDMVAAGRVLATRRASSASGP